MIADVDTLVYLLIGSGEHRNEAVFSAYSALRASTQAKRPSPPAIVFYTDAPFHTPSDLPVVTNLISPFDYTKWTLNSKSFFRLKFYVLKHALSTFGGTCLYLDADTYFMRSPHILGDRVKPGKSLMHVREGKIDQHWQSLVGRSFSGCDGRPRVITDSDEMWNAGVIGIHHSDSNLVDEFVAVHDSLGPPYHGLFEQYAVASVLRRRTGLSSANDCIYHYWGSQFRRRYAQILERCLAESTKMAPEVRAEFLYSYRPRLTLWQTCRQAIQRIPLALELTHREPIASHGCYAPGLPREFRSDED